MRRVLSSLFFVINSANKRDSRRISRKKKIRNSEINIIKSRQFFENLIESFFNYFDKKLRLLYFI